jgi:S-DNA-T family DNA segregation ATPase FtsK/SpoIIIE
MVELAIFKIVGLASCGYGLFQTWRLSPKQRVKTKLLEIFRKGELCAVKKYDKKEVRIYPKIHSVRQRGQSIEAVFTLLDGIDPAKVHKFHWLFKQKFGEKTELEGTTKKFVLTINPKQIEAYQYKFIGSDLKLPIYVGMSREGIEFYDMVDYPHLLIAGETGSGKSTQLRSIITTLIKSNLNLELYMADLKRSEFHLFKNIAEVVVDSASLKKMLKKLKKEMVRRGNLLDTAEVAHVDDLQDKISYIILCIDEVALLKKEKECMEIIEEISAIGRALGVFLILSMQRPDMEVLNGKLKNNLTVRMAFRHSDEINSRITLGSGEAAHIQQSEKGKMMFKLDGIKAVRAPHLTLDKAKTLLQPYKRTEALTEALEDEQLFGVLE